MKLHTVDREVLEAAVKPLRPYAGKLPEDLPTAEGTKYAILLAEGAQALMVNATLKGNPLTASEAVAILTNQLSGASFSEPKTAEDRGAFWAARITEARENAAAQGRALTYAEAAQEACARVAGGPGWGGKLDTVVEVVR